MNTLLANATCLEPSCQIWIVKTFIFVCILIFIISIIIWCKIFRKTGYSWALGLLMLVPVANLVMFLILAFTKWPIEKELEDLKKSINEE